MAAVASSSTGTGDVQAVNRGAVVVGVNVVEVATTPAAAEVVIRDGTDATGAEIVRFKLAAEGTVTAWYGDLGVLCTTGVFVDRVSGETRVTVYTK